MAFPIEEEEKGEQRRRSFQSGDSRVSQILEQAESFIEDFFSTNIELIQNFKGQLNYWRGEK